MIPSYHRNEFHLMKSNNHPYTPDHHQPERTKAPMTHKRQSTELGFSKLKQKPANKKNDLNYPSLSLSFFQQIIPSVIAGE